MKIKKVTKKRKKEVFNMLLDCVYETGSKLLDEGYKLGPIELLRDTTQVIEGLYACHQKEGKNASARKKI